METNRTTQTTSTTAGQVMRAATSAACAALFAFVLIFGAPRDDTSRWDGVDAHSDVSNEVALDTLP